MEKAAKWIVIDPNITVILQFREPVSKQEAIEKLDRYLMGDLTFSVDKLKEGLQKYDEGPL